jgi:hypothetical protein
MVQMQKTFKLSRLNGALWTKKINVYYEEGVEFQGAINGTPKPNIF